MSLIQYTLVICILLSSSAFGEPHAPILQAKYPTVPSSTWDKKKAFRARSVAHTVHEFETAKDGSRRNFILVDMPIKPKGRGADIHLNPKPKQRPALTDKQMDYQWFGIRTSGIRLSSFKQSFPKLAKRLPKTASKLSRDKTLEGRYQYAKLLWHIPWLETEQTATQILSQLVKEQHIPAMYHLGINQFKSMVDIPNGVSLVHQAAKGGHAFARYRLGTIIQFSPWVETDLAKALYWYEAAADTIEPAKLRAAEIRLTGPATLIDYQKAKKWLDSAKKTKHSDPMYQYLMATYYRHSPGKNIKLAIRHLESAINMGNRHYWDTSQWQAQLAELLKGQISVKDLG